MNDEKIPLVLIVDDDSSIRSLLKLALESKGYKIEEAANGKECLAKYERCQPDIVLLDALMPEMDGFTCCQSLRSLPGSNETPILMLTFLDDLSSIDQAFQAGATDYLTKPIHWPVLFQRVQRLLAASQAQAIAAQLQQQQAWEKLLREILQHLSGNDPLDLILPTIVAKIREFFQVERIVLYLKGDRPIVESVAPTYPSVQNISLKKLSLETEYALQYQQGQIITIDNLASAELSSDALSLLRQLKIQALLIAPILTQKHLWGLLCAHHCQNPHTWEKLEIERFSDLGNLLSFSLSASTRTVGSTLSADVTFGGNST
jgi:DNA-binding response OmpR family regulator